MEFGHAEARKAYRKKSDKTAKPAVKARPRINRAMSRDNVEPPEQANNETSPREKTNVYGGTGGRRRGRKKQEALIDDSAEEESEEFLLSPPQRVCPSILEKLKDRPSISEDDLRDPDNRRLLHCIVYKTTLGIDFSKLRDTVEQELNESPSEALRRPTPPLYIEPAN